MKRQEVLVGVSGGIAAFKAAALVSQLAQAELGVRVVLTESAAKFVGEATFAALSGRPVARQDFDTQQFPLGGHIMLAAQADLLCVAPATANFLAKAAHGLADDLLSTLYLEFAGPVLVAPAMSCQMWQQPAVQRNVRQLVDDGVQMIGPDEGWLSCRKRGPGRMAAPDAILAAILQRLSSL